MFIHTIQQPLVQAITQQLPIDFLIVVGSFAKGKEHAKSDLDIVYASSTSFVVDEETALIQSLMDISGREVDLINFQQTDADFKVHVVTEGLPIYIKDEQAFRLLVRELTAART